MHYAYVYLYIIHICVYAYVNECMYRECLMAFKESKMRQDQSRLILMVMLAETYFKAHTYT